MSDASPKQRIVRTRSIPNVDNERLLTDLQRIHDMFHTPEGMHAFNGPRREMINHGMKCLKIQRELTERHVNTNIDCRWCGN